MTTSRDRPGEPPAAEESSSWTTETLSISERRDLLKKELTRLGFGNGSGKPEAQRPVGQQQQQPQPPDASRPSAGSDGDGKDGSPQEAPPSAGERR